MSTFTNRGNRPASKLYGERFKNLPVEGSRAFRASCKHHIAIGAGNLLVIIIFIGCLVAPAVFGGA